LSGLRMFHHSTVCLSWPFVKGLWKRLRF
jgi:hypothetical protein